MIACSDDARASAETSETITGAQMDPRLRCARANWRPPIWRRANSRPGPSVHLFLFQCLSLLCLLVPLSLAGDGAELAPAKVDKSSLETYNLASARSTRLAGEEREDDEGEESSPPARTNNFRNESAADNSAEEQLSPILFATTKESALTSSSSAVTVNLASRPKRSQREPANGARQHRKVIHAMLRGHTQLACNLDSSEPDDSVSLVLWYKDGSMVPVFSLDARSAPNLQEARHKPGPLLEGRSSMRLLWRDPTATNLHADDNDERDEQRDGPAASTTTTTSRRHTSEGRRKRRARQRPEVQNDNNSGPAEMGPESSALVAAPRARQLWAQLQIEALSSEDTGVYVCRVDFRRARARIQELALKIIVPADTPTIRDLSRGGPATGTPADRARVMGPYNEGSRVVLECETQGGYPEPHLSWWRDGRLVDDSYEIVSAQDGLVIGQVRPSGPADQEEPPDEGATRARPEEQSGQPEVDGTQAREAGPPLSGSAARSAGPARLFRNRLELGPLARSDLLANYSCRAQNSKLQKEPPSSFAMIDMNLRPVKVQIDNERLPVLADRPLEIVCRAFGSRPAALISWFRGPSSSSGDKLVPQHPPELQQRAPMHGQQAVGFALGQIKIEESIGAESNVTSSTLTIWPRPQDSGQMVTCRAENPYMLAGPLGEPAQPNDIGGAATPMAAPAAAASAPTWIEDSWKLEVHYLPRVHLQLGDKLKGQSIREGQDVYFECRVQAQPFAHEIRWWLNGKELESNQSQGLIVSNQSLVLQRVLRSQRGHYTCSAINAVGESHSSSLYLRVQFAPICRDLPSQANSSLHLSAGSDLGRQSTDLFRASSQQRAKSKYGAARMESVRVLCHVDADPAEGLVYRWAFVPLSSQPDSSNKQQQQQMVYLDANSFGQEQELGPLVSVATYTPRSELDYGTLLCWAQNELGQQADPCAYQLVAAEPPDPVRNCRLLNASDSQLMVACEPGYDGGIDQSFQMEVYDSRKRELVANVSSSEPPQSDLNKTAPDIHSSGSAQLQQEDREQDDSPSSVALSLTSAGHQPKQRHSAAQQLVSNSSGRFRPQPLAALNANHHHLETLFITEPNLRPSTHYLLSIYSQNSKGASKPVAFTASTANATHLGPATESAPSARARFFSSSGSSQSSLSEPSSHLLSDVLALSWSPFLLVCAISVALFVLFGSLTFAMMKYVDQTQAGGSNGASNSSDCQLAALKQSACLSKSDEQSGAGGGGGGGSGSSSATTSSCGSTTNMSSMGQNRLKPRTIMLTANKTGANCTGFSAHGTEPLANQNEQQTREKVSLLGSGSSYLRAKLQQISEKQQLKQSNSDNYLDQLAPKEPPTGSGAPRQPVAFSSSSLQRPNNQRQPLLLNYVPVPGEQQPRMEQLLISGKQYFHQTAPKQRAHLQMTAAHQYGAHRPPNQRQPYAPSPLMKQFANHEQTHQQQQQLIDGEHYCQHAADLSSSSSSPLHLAHLRLVEMSTTAAGQPQQLAHIDSDSTTNSTTNHTLPSLFSFSHNTTNGSPSSGIVVATPTPTTCSTAGAAGVGPTDPLQDSHQLQQHQQQQQYCCGTAMGQLAGGSNSTITSSIEQPALIQQMGLHELAGGNVISVSDCLLGATAASNLSGGSSCSAASNQHPHHHRHRAQNISSNQQQQFDGASDGGFEETNNNQQYLAYSALGLPHHHLVCQSDLSQYSVYVDHETAVAAAATLVGPDANNNNHLQQQQIYLLQEQAQAKYPTKARVRVFQSGNSGSASLDRGATTAGSGYLKPSLKPQEARTKQDDSQHPAHLQTDV